MAVLATLSAAAWLGAQEPVVAIEAGFVHPVSAPTIQDGVVLIRGDRIVAVGRRGEVEIPASATRISHPDGHVYPGLVDAMSDAFADESVLMDDGADAGTPIQEGLDSYLDASWDLVGHGVTTAYVSNRADTQWRGIGAVLRPKANGYEVFPESEGAVQLRLTTGEAPSHPLSRQGLLGSAANAFQTLDAYRRQLADHEKAMAEYQEAYQAYLDYYRQNRGAAPAGGRGQGGRRGQGRGGARRGGQGQRGQGRGGRRGQRGATDATQPPPAQAAGAQAQQAEQAAPEKPDYPPALAREPDKDALVQVLEGERALRIEAQRQDEVLAALRLADEQGIPRVVLEYGAAAGALAEELALRGVPVVLLDILPGTAPEAYGGGDTSKLPAVLADAGVAVAIASGSVRNAEHLPLVAAYAVGRGLDPDTALRALTLTPAEILGVSREVGSLEPGKLADVVILSAPIFASDAQVLRVLSAGVTQFEAR